ncbi:MAG: hypothetical protein ACYC48_02235 [Minisyncoccota bacterium]
MKLLTFFTNAGASQGASSEFSRFFREASSREKKKVFMDVARKASADQKRVIEASRAV